MEIRTPLEAFLHWESKTPDAIFLRQPFHGSWREHTYRDAGLQVRKVASSIRKKVPPKAKVALLSKNCAEWIMADLAIMMAGLVSVPIYPTLSAESIKPMLIHSDASLIIVGKLDAFEKQRHAIDEGLPVISMDAYGIKEGMLWSEIEKNEELFQPDTLPEPHEVATIMYSSGTTGEPKGVMLTHEAFAFVGEKVATHLRILQPEKFFSYLPLSHIAERALMEMVAMHSGSTISFTESLEKFAENLREVRPTIFGGVPRIYTKFQEGILKKLPASTLDTLMRIPGGIL